MATRENSSAPLVTIAGGGTAGLEALLAARALLGDGARLQLIEPAREFRYRPINPDSPLQPARERTLPIADVVAHAGATWITDHAAFVDDDAGSVLTRDGDTVAFDYLLLAAGGRFKRSLRQGELWVRGGDPGVLDRLIFDLRAREASSVAVVVPRGARWSVPAYELALVMAWSSAGSGARITLVTAERAPLIALGDAASEAVAAELESAGIELRTATEAAEPPLGEARRTHAAELILIAEGDEDAAGALTGTPTDRDVVLAHVNPSARFDRVISVPTVLGPLVGGLAADAAGFVEVDETLRVRGARRVWAAGGCIAAPLEHSGLAALQADAAVAAIAADAAGRHVEPARLEVTELTGILLTGQRERWLAENPPGIAQPSTRCLWWPPGRAVGKMLARQIAAWDPSVESALPSGPNGLPIRAEVPFEHRAVAIHAGVAASDEERQRDIENRQQRAIERRAREADAYVRSLQDRLDELAARQQDTIRELRQHGYLSGR